VTNLRIGTSQNLLGRIGVFVAVFLPAFPKFLLHQFFF